MREWIEAGLQSLNLSPKAGSVLAEYGYALIEGNRVMNLTAITEPEQVARLHMLDCAALLQAAPLAGCSLLDVGSGAGFPGLVLKLCEPSIQLTLLDAQRKRVQWLEELAPALGAADVRCLHARAEELARITPYREGFDVVTSRAVAELRVLAELCLPFVKVGGMFLAMKAADCAEELDRAGRAVSILGGQLCKVFEYQIPDTDVRRRVVRIRKVRPTPEAYPRRFAKMKKTPL